MAPEYDFIVVGSGAGGGPLACNLALAPEGYRVALLEAGTDPATLAGSPTFYHYAVPGLHPRAAEDPAMSWEFFVQHYSAKERQSKDYDSKYDSKNGGIFYPRAAAVGGCTSHHAMITLYPHRDDWQQMQDLTGDPTWSPEVMRRYFQALEDCQYLPGPGSATGFDPATRHGFGGWLPLSMPDPTLALGDPQLLAILLRAFLIAHISTHPLGDKTGEGVEEVLADRTRTEQALNKAVQSLLQAAQRASSRLPNSARGTFTALKRALEAARKAPGGRKPEEMDAPDLLDAYVHDIPALSQLFQLAHSWLDPNRWFEEDQKRVGAFNTPASILHGVRTGVRERILAVRALYPDRLHLITGALVTSVILKKKDGGEAPRLQAVGVRYLENGRYQATPAGAPSRGRPQPRELHVRPNGEVILAGGAFNTPQLLMLSGVGPLDHLKEKKIECLCDLPGVGQNLQDRYEVGVVAELPHDFEVLQGITLQAPGDRCPPDSKAPAAGPDRGMRDWMNHGGVYASNLAVLTIIKRSRQAAKDRSPVPDLFIFGLPGNFRGYAKGYSCDILSEKKDDKVVPNHRRFTWAILKGRTHNTAGFVKLRSDDPRARPEINFRYFDDDPDPAKKEDYKKDLEALVEGVRFALRLVRDRHLKAEVIWPEAKDLKDHEAVREFIKRESWGHHACGTCKIGKDGDEKAVLDGDFRVRGVRNLRVVDASVFPKIPGFFIVTSIYMISEKASDVILADRKLADTGKPPRKPWPGRPGHK